MNIISLLFVITIISTAIGLLLDFLAYANCRKNKEKPEETNGRENDTSLRISGDSDKPKMITEKFVNYCIIAGFVIIALLVIIDFSGIADNYELDGFFSRAPDELTIYKESDTFREKINGTKKSGTYEVNGSLLTLHYSDGKIADYYIEQNMRVLRPANLSRLTGEEWNENCYIKPHLS